MARSDEPEPPTQVNSSIVSCTTKLSPCTASAKTMRWAASSLRLDRQQSPVAATGAPSTADVDNLELTQHLVGRRRSLLFVLFLELAKIAPAGILVGLGGIGVFLALQPKTKPVHVPLL